MADHYFEFQKMGAEVLAISTDSIYAHKIFAQTSPSASKVQYPLLSDRNHAITKAYGAYKPSLGAATRTTVIISPEGLIKYYCKYPLSVGRNPEELIRVLAALQFAELTNLGVPAQWQPGEPGIPREWNLVGKI